MISSDHLLGAFILAVGFAATFFGIKVWMRAAARAGLVGKDINKYYKKDVTESAGIIVVMSFVLMLLMLVFFKTFLVLTGTHLIEIFAIVLSVALGGFLGFVDTVLGWKRGLPQWTKPLLTIPVAIPLMVISIEDTSLLGVNLGIFYSLLVVPLGIVGASNAFNMLEGLNGIAGGMGILILGALGLMSFIKGDVWLAFAAFCMVSSLLAYLWYNKYPASVFGGDSLTYSVGAAIAVVAILGGNEIVATLLFIPYFVEFAIKAKWRFKTECFGIPQKDGTLKPPEKVGSLTHILMRYGKTEWGTVKLLYLFECILIGLAFILAFFVPLY